MEKQRIVLVGHGGISQSYLKAFAGMESAVICGVVGRNLTKVQAYAREHGISVAGTSLEEVARRAEATAVVICTPNATHYEGVMEAARLGLHCLCEKPLHIDPVRQQEMVGACREHGVKLAVSYMRRLISHVRFVKELIDSGRLGRIMVMDVTIKHFRDKAYYQSWHGTYEHDGGGPFIQQGSHIIDMALWLGGGYRQVLSSTLFQVYHDIETEDHGYAVVQYGNGAVGMIEASTASIGMKKEMIELSGTKGSLSFNYGGITRFEVPGVELPVFAGEEDNAVLFKRLAADFLKAIESGQEPFINGESAQLATELVQEIYKQAGHPVRIGEQQSF